MPLKIHFSVTVWTEYTQ